MPEFAAGWLGTTGGAWQSFPPQSWQEDRFGFSPNELWPHFRHHHAACISPKKMFGTQQSESVLSVPTGALASLSLPSGGAEGKPREGALGGMQGRARRWSQPGLADTEVKEISLPFQAIWANLISRRQAFKDLKHHVLPPYSHWTLLIPIQPVLSKLK